MSVDTVHPPIIGITLDIEPPGGFAATPWYALRQNYFDSVAASGAVPVALPYHPEYVETYLSMCDGLVISGGDFDVDPSLFGEEIHSSEVKLKPQRTAFEKALVEGALARSLPLLGICGGEQLMAALSNGGLVQHIPDEYGEHVSHSSLAPGKRRFHSIDIEPESLLAQLTQPVLKQLRREVNSSHHQSVRSVGKGWLINAYSDEKVVEGIEKASADFCLGVQWHPEYLDSEADRAIFDGLIAAAKRYHQSRKG